MILIFTFLLKVTLVKSNKNVFHHLDRFTHRRSGGEEGLSHNFAFARTPMDLPSNLPSNLPFRCLCINSYPKQLMMTSSEINPAAWGEIFPCSSYFLYIFLMTLLLPSMFFCFALFSPFSPSCEPKTGCGMWFHVLHTLPTMTHTRRSTINECEVTFLRLWRHSL